jgi:hypothetical protein
VANSNRRNNSIDQLVVNGTISLDQTMIREHIARFYDNLFTKQLSWWPRLDGLIFIFYSILGKGGGGHLVGETIRER